MTAEDYAVYGALMASLQNPDYLGSAGSRRLLVLGTTATPTEAVSTVHWNAHDSDNNAVPEKATLADLEAKMGAPCAVTPQFGDPRSYDILDSRAVEALFAKHSPRRYLGWDEFYKKYPNSGGYWAFSRPGYNQKGNEAVLWVIHACGSRCGNGQLFFLTREDGRWKVKNRSMLWIS